ncbi:MAG: hypothetical protein QW478_01705 [Candidatus Micrarchaeaceae archaeon]
MTSSVIQCLSLPNSGSCTVNGTNITCTFTDSEGFIFTDTANQCKTYDQGLICTHPVTGTSGFTYLNTSGMTCLSQSTSASNTNTTYFCNISANSSSGSLSLIYGPGHSTPIFSCQASPVSGIANSVTCLCTTSNIEQPSGPSQSSFLSGISGPINVICDSNNVRVSSTRNSVQPQLASPFFASSYLTSPFFASPYVSSPFFASPYVTSQFMTSPYLASPFFVSPYVSSPFFSPPHLTSPFFTTNCMNRR